MFEQLNSINVEINLIPIEWNAIFELWIRFWHCDADATSFEIFLNAFSSQNSKWYFSILKMKIFYQDEHKNKCSKIRWHSCTFQAIWHMLYCRTVFLLLLSKTAVVIFQNVFILFFLFRQQGTRDGSRIFVALFDYDPPTMSPNPEACDEELPFREGQLIKVSKNKTFWFLTCTFSFRHEFQPITMGHSIKKQKHFSVFSQNWLFITFSTTHNVELGISYKIICVACDTQSCIFTVYKNQWSLKN